MAAGDKYYKGKGKLWIDGTLYAEVYEIDFKRKEEFEEVPNPNGNGVIQVHMGYSIEGSIKMRKKGNEAVMKRLAESKNAIEFPIIAKEINEQTGDYETKKYVGCTIDEFPLSQYSNRKITEIELAVKAVDYEILA